MRARGSDEWRLSWLNHYRLPGGASRLAALLIGHLCPISSLFAPCDPGAARRHPILIQPRQATRFTLASLLLAAGFATACGDNPTQPSGVSLTITCPAGLM